MSPRDDARKGAHRGRAAWFLRGYVPLAVLGCLSLLALVPVLAPAVETFQARSKLGSVPTAGLYAFLLAAPAVLLLALTALGVALVRKVGLRSLIADAARGQRVRWASRRKTAGLAGATVVATLLVVAADAGFARAFPEAFAGVPPATAVPLTARVGALLYGAVAEELMLRLGMMTLLVAAGRRLFPAAFARNPGAVLWPAIAVTAVLFGALHLPGLAAMAPLTAPVIARTIVLNAALGLLFGFAYWRYALEYAMLSHALVHVVFGVVGAVGPNLAPALTGS
jgi:hypothetical protein